MTRKTKVEYGTVFVNGHNLGLGRKNADGSISQGPHVVDPGESVRVTLPAHLVKAIRQYNAKDWKDGRDPSKLGALNAVAYIGEQVAALIARKDK